MTATIETQVPARLDRLPWSRFHNRVLVGLGLVWLLDGLEVTMVGSVATRLTAPDSGVRLTTGDIGIAAAIYVVGACVGALFFGRMTDKFGRKHLFMITLGVYIVATVATAFAFAPWFFFAARFFTGSGIGGEYAAVNSAVDELIPARVRGRIDLLINGTYWLGAAGGSALTILFLNRGLLAADLGWRLAFAVGAVLGLTILLVRRNVPESPRWLFIHGREDRAEQITGGIEDEVRRETGKDLEPVQDSLRVRQRSSIPFRIVARTAFVLYPRRAILGVALFVGQAFIYNGITFNLGTLFSSFYDVSGSIVPIFLVIYGFGNFLGPVLLGRLFDTLGRKPMIAGTYLGAAVMTIPLALVFLTGAVGAWVFIVFIVATFFLASTGASAAYLTVSEIFPMETRALAIAFFYALGTGLGGIIGPLLFGQLIATGDRGPVTIGFFISAFVMAIGGVAELVFGVKAEGASLENIAKPLTVEEAQGDQPEGGGGPSRGPEPAAGQPGSPPVRPSRPGKRAAQRPARRPGHLPRRHRGDHRSGGRGHRRGAAQQRTHRPRQAGAARRREPVGSGPVQRRTARGRGAGFGAPGVPPQLRSARRFGLSATHRLWAGSLARGVAGGSRVGGTRVFRCGFARVHSVWCIWR